MSKNKLNNIDEATGHYYDPGWDDLERSSLKKILSGLGIVGAIKWLEKRGDSVHDDRNKEELKKIKKQLKGYKFSKAQLDKRNKEGMKLKDILGKLLMGDKLK